MCSLLSFLGATAGIKVAGFILTLIIQAILAGTILGGNPLKRSYIFVLFFYTFPYQHITNEWMVKDTSKKIKSAFRSKGMSGKPNFLPFM